jgi:hypothetical protein
LRQKNKAGKHESTKLKHILFLPLVFQRGFPKESPKESPEESPKELSKRKSKEEKERGVGKTAYTKRVLPKQPIT